MLSSLPIIISELIEPISDENPAGKNLREDMSLDSSYQKIKTLRGKLRERERDMTELENNRDLLSDWKIIVENAIKIIKQESKDIEVIAWLIEGLTRVYGFKGLTCGFELIYVLIDKFWDTLYPLEDEDGINTKLSALIGLNGARNNGTLIIPINCITLFTYQDILLATWHYQQAFNNKSNNEEIDKKNHRAITLELFEEAANFIGFEKIQKIYEEIESCLIKYQNLCQLLDEKCQREHSPPSSNIRNALQTCLETIQNIQKLVIQPVVQNEEEYEGAEEDSSREKPDILINDRQKAFQSLQNVANYFRENEPHSPVPFLVEKAIRLGNMTLPEILAELVPDERMLSHSYQLLGAQQMEEQE